MIQPDRTQAPPFQLSTDYSLAEPETYTFPGGQSLFVFRNLPQNAIKLELTFKAGKWYESKSGLSHFAAQLLRKGTRTKTSFEIADALDTLGAHLEVAAGFDTLTLSLYVLRKNLFRALDILLDILREPGFDEGELRQEKEIFIQNLRVSNEKTGVVASREIRKVIFGPHHPYGNSTEESDVSSISTHDLHTFFDDHIRLNSGYLVGPVADAELQRLLSTLSLAGASANEPDEPPTAPGRSLVLPKAGSVQASIRLGKRCLAKRDDPAYYDSVMVNHLLGGFFGSRLMKNIREEKGLTYGIHSALHHFHHGSFWVISAEVNQQNTQRALDEIRNEIRELQEVPVSQDELDVARNYFIGSWQSDNATLFAVAEKVRNIHDFRLPTDYYTRLLGHLQRITPEHIQHAAKKYFSESDLLEVQVG